LHREIRSSNTSLAECISPTPLIEQSHEPAEHLGHEISLKSRGVEQCRRVEDREDPLRHGTSSSWPRRISRPRARSDEAPWRCPNAELPPSEDELASHETPPSQGAALSNMNSSSFEV
jgi:hypothetical protein